MNPSIGANVPCGASPNEKQGDVLCALNEVDIQLRRQAAILNDIESIMFSPKPEDPKDLPSLSPNTLPNTLNDTIRRIDAANTRMNEVRDALYGLFAGGDFHLV